MNEYLQVLIHQQQYKYRAITRNRKAVLLLCQYIWSVVTEKHTIITVVCVLPCLLHANLAHQHIFQDVLAAVTLSASDEIALPDTDKADDVRYMRVKQGSRPTLRG
jgi:hypothetical protein